MSNDIDLYSNGGDLAPYSPSQPLAPTADSLGNTDVDYLGGNQHYQSTAPQLFGEALPAGTTPEQMQHVLTEIAAVIGGDLMRLGDSPHLIAIAVDWLGQNAGKAPRKERITHRFSLYQYQNDVATNNWANYMHQAGADQTFIDHTLWLLDQLSERLNNGKAHDQAPAMDGNPTSGDPLDSLSDEQYAQVVAINDRAKAATTDYLKDLWQSSYYANIKMVNQYFQSLPQHEQEYLSQMTSGWISGLNTREIILGLYRQAIGAGSISNSGSGVADEISAIENLMRTDRKSYMKDDRLQARYRHLLTLRGY